jgi:hypothetical protein
MTHLPSGEVIVGADSKFGPPALISYPRSRGNTDELSACDRI